MGHMLKSRLPCVSICKWKARMTAEYCHSQGPQAEYPVMRLQTAPQFHFKAPKTQRWYTKCVTQPVSSSAQDVPQLNFTYHKKILAELPYTRSRFAFPSCDTHQRTQVSQESCREAAKQKLCIRRGSSPKPTMGQKYPTLPHLQFSVPTPRAKWWSQQLLCWFCIRKNTFFRQELTTKFPLNR